MRLQKILHTVIGISLFVVVSAGVVGMTFVVSSVAELSLELASITALKEESFSLSSEVFDRSGVKIGEFAAERRYFVALKELPKHVIQAFLSAEDKDFYTHLGISPKAILRSALANIRGNGIKQGASTITQQLARLYFLDQQKTWERKFKEAVLAVAIERKLTKDEILELYLNKIYFGNRSYGIESAARNYFRKNAADLSIGEAAILAGLPKSPTAYAPNKHPEAASRRQFVVLKRMEEDGFLSKGDPEAWAKAVIHVSERPEDFSGKAPYFVAEVQRELARKFEFDRLPQYGLRVYTTLDSGLQKAAEKNLAAALESAKEEAVTRFKRKPQIQGALYSIDPANGAVLAMQGGGRFAVSQFNRAESARRRTSGLFLPLYVSLALERGYTALSRVGDDPIGGRRQTAQSGAPTLYDAVLQGLYVDSTPLYTALGNGSVLQHAKRLGLSFDHDDLTIALGYGEASPAQMAVAYAAFANGGKVVHPYVVERVEDLAGHELYRARHEGANVAMSPQTAYIMNQILVDSVVYGQADGAKGVTPLAGGASAATDDLHDAWFVGVLPNVTTAIWLGAETGDVRLAATEAKAADLAEGAWASFMRAAPPRILRQVRPLSPPDGMSFARTASRSLPFVAGTEPGSENARF